MNPQPFDPFRDRVSRDIRNDLSEALLACMAEHSLTPARLVADRFLALEPGPEQVAYIHSRLERYQHFLDLMTGARDPLRQALVLWDLGLFFEVHEILEHAWLRAQGEEKLFYQAMIRAAGVYIKQEFGFAEAAGKMATKALPVLETNRHRLAVHTDPERLVAGLRSPHQPPPRLLNEAFAAKEARQG